MALATKIQCQDIFRFYGTECSCFKARTVIHIDCNRIANAIKLAHRVTIHSSMDGGFFFSKFCHGVPRRMQ